MPELVNFGKPEETFKNIEDKATTDADIKVAKYIFDQDYEEPSNSVDIVSDCRRLIRSRIFSRTTRKCT